MDFVKDNFYCIDFAIGATIPLAVLLLYTQKKISPFTWKLFWAGTLIGLTWEIPLSALDGLGIVDIFTFMTPPPAHFIVLIISHSFWDGGLFLAGLWLVNVLCPEPRFAAFKVRELAVLVAWGQVQELGVELLSAGSGGWWYNPTWWNPSLFLFNGRPVTLVPQLIWLAAPVLFYFAGLRIRKKE
ncbi:MAG TPA: hypothetical protein PLC28_05250 [Spirochaetota bacterium]|nr:hypothetical protein [Spirochaetota bacterium]HPL18225.1 hypothetical protein [Spirochaetota bacterium]HRS76391.1 hypothetical protein [Spirochaetota bacterium]HRT73886.1 hypothetical protein [Spirochaetota bacterium]